MLLSSNDLKAIQAALDVGRELLLERRFGDICLRVTTAPAPPVWDTVKMLARLEIWRG